MPCHNETVKIPQQRRISPRGVIRRMVMRKRADDKDEGAPLDKQLPAGSDIAARQVRQAY